MAGSKGTVGSTIMGVALGLLGPFGAQAPAESVTMDLDVRREAPADAADLTWFPSYPGHSAGFEVQRYDDSDGGALSARILAGASTNVAIVDSTQVIHGGNFPITGSPLDAFNFALLAVADVNAANLAAFDTVLLNVGGPGMSCTTGSLTSAQKDDLVDFVFAGGKLIISDSECPSADYSWLPYPFTTNNPGALGAHGTLFIAEENVLSTNAPNNPYYYIDAATLGSQTDAVDDMKSVVRIRANGKGKDLDEAPMGDQPQLDARAELIGS